MSVRLAILCFVLLMTIGLATGCNLYEGLSTPAGDAQVLSKARACFDQGDYTCASQYYAQLSSADSDIAYSEEAFLILAQAGASSGVFINAVLGTSGSIGSSGNAAGAFLTRLAISMTNNSPGVTTRSSLYQAYAKYQSISNSSLAGLVRFITSATLLAEVFAEAAQTKGQLNKSDLVETPSTCTTITFTNLASVSNASACAAPSGSALKDDVLKGQVSNSLSTPMSETAMTQQQPDLYLVLALVNEIDYGIQQLTASGPSSSLGSSSTSFSQIINSEMTSLTNALGSDPFSDSAFDGGIIPGGVGAEAFRQVLIQAGIGN